MNVFAELSRAHEPRAPKGRPPKAPLYVAKPPAAHGAQCACGGGCPRCREGHAAGMQSHGSEHYGRSDSHFADGDAKVLPTPAPEQLGGAPGTSEEAKPIPADDSSKTKAACPKFISLTVAVAAPRIGDACDGCRLELGCCPTKRGTCGTTKDSGAAFKGTVEVPEGCTGELGFMQNLMTTDRKRTLDDKSEECTTSTSALADGGVPWKGCSISVTKAGTHTVESDDCPNLKLKDNMVSASASDSFKTFLVWKPTGKSWNVIGHAEWGWSGATTRQKGTDCKSNWTAPGGQAATVTGAASTDKPVTSPKAQDLDWAPCPKKKP